MTKFVKNQFSSSGYIHYEFEGTRHFIARFKYAKGGAAAFISFLINNFEVEEYLAEMKAGKSPLPIVEAKGFVLPHIKKWLREAGLPQTQEGFQTFLSQQIAARETLAQRNGKLFV